MHSIPINVSASKVIKGEVSEEELSKYLKSQKRYIEKSKWYEGERIHKDPGDEFILQWINSSSEKYRKIWDLCLCKNCVKGSECGDCLKIDCDDFKLDQK